jgi:Ca2+-binding EF-hand superfamily protein
MFKILAILAIATLTLQAAEGAANDGKHRGEHKQAMLEKFDTDKDGKLSEAERAAAKEQGKHHLKELKAKFDTDGDGKLSDSERDAARAAFAARLKEKHPQLFAKIDSNGDGTLSREEAKAAREQLRAHRGERGQVD